MRSLYCTSAGTATAIAPPLLAAGEGAAPQARTGITPSRWRGLTCETVNPLLTRGPLELVPGILRDEGRGILASMGKLRGQRSV